MSPARGALYGLFAVSIAGAASAPLFVVERLPQEAGQDGAGAGTSVREAPALAAPPKQAATRLEPPEPETAAAFGPAVRPTVEPASHSGIRTAASRHQLRDHSIRHDVVATAFQPAPVAAWLPDPASYVARQSATERAPVLPAVSVDPVALAADIPPPPTTDSAITRQSQGLAKREPEPGTGNESNAPPAGELASTISKVVEHEARDIALNAPPDSVQIAPARQPEPDPDAIAQTDQEEDSATPIVIAAASNSLGSPSQAEGTGDRPDLPEAKASLPTPELSTSPAPLLAQEDAVDDEVVIVAQAGPQKLQAVAIVEPAGSDVVVVAADSHASKQAGVSAQLAGMSLALSTTLGASTARLARGVELPNWAAMGKDSKLRLTR